MAMYFDDFDKLFRDYEKRMNQLFRQTMGAFPKVSQPITDISESATKFVIKLDMPGITKKNIDLVAIKDSIEIKAERKELKEDKKKQFYKQERAFRSYYRRISLPAEIIPNKIKADYKDGVLTIDAPKKKVAKAKEKKLKIKVK